MPTVSAIIPAAGVGKRFDPVVKKQFFLVDGNPLIYYTLKAMHNAWPFDEFVVGAAPEDFKYISRIADKLGIKRLSMTEGGDTRTGTVLNALRKSKCDFVAIHDAARPFVTPATVKATIETGMEHGAAICGLPARDTVKRVKDRTVVCTEERSTIFLAHTPQVFRRELLLRVLEKANAENLSFTDESGAYESTGHKVTACLSNADNIKITEPADIAIAQVLVKKYFS